MFEMIKKNTLLFTLMLHSYFGSTAFASTPSLELANNKEDNAIAEQLSCGARAGYLFGRQYGAVWSYTDTKELMPFTEDGMSLNTIQEGLIRRSISCEIRRLNPSQLPLVQTPVIVHLLPRSNESKVGHFILLTSANKQGVSVIDPISLLHSEWRWEYFSDRWSGYAITKTASFLSIDYTLTGIVLVHIATLLYCLNAHLSDREFNLQ